MDVNIYCVTIVPCAIVPSLPYTCRDWILSCGQQIVYRKKR